MLPFRALTVRSEAMPMGPALLSGALGLAKTQKDRVALGISLEKVWIVW